MTTPTIPNYEPFEIIRGETIAWTKSVSGYPASDGWELTTYFRGPGPGVNVVATPDGSGYSNVMTAAESLPLAAGTYYWQAWVSRGADETLERYLVGSGSVVVKQGFAGIDTETPVDGRSENETMLEAVKVALGKSVAKNAASYTIANRMKSEHSIPDLIALHDRLVQLVNQERHGESVRNGNPFLQNVFTRFR